MRIPLKNYLDKLGLSKLKREHKEIVTSFLNGKDIIGYQLGFEKVYVVTYKSCLKEKKVCINIIHGRFRLYKFTQN